MNIWDALENVAKSVYPYHDMSSLGQVLVFRILIEKVTHERTIRGLRLVGISAVLYRRSRGSTTSTLAPSRTIKALLPSQAFNNPVLRGFLGLLTTRTMPSHSPWDEMVIKHKWDAIPDSWLSLGPPPSGTTIKLHIALKPDRDNALTDALHEVSHPRHPKYGAHLSREQVSELVAPHPDTLELVLSWFKYNGVPTSSISMTHGGSWLTVAGFPVFRANKLLGASYELYYHTGSNETILRTVGYSLPAVLHQHIKTIAPTTAFTSTGLLQQTPLNHSDREAAPTNGTLGEPSDVLSRDEKFVVKPEFLRWLYKMPLDDPAPTDRNKLGIPCFVNKWPRADDLFKFIQRFRSDVAPAFASAEIVKVVPVNGGAAGDWTSSSKQTSLDTQYSVALTFPTPIEYYTIGGTRRSSPDDGLPVEGDQNLEWLNYMINMESVPQTVSVPYFTRETALSEEYTKNLCDLFKILGARGVSVLVASGDQGVGCGISGATRPTPFSTNFPASCPYVTSVGGTTGFGPEVASEKSGGGFSDHFERPDYQNDAVIPFLDKPGSQYPFLYNPLGRGVPDIAMQSMNYEVIFRGKVLKSSSTILSTSTAAAIIALLNDYLVSNDKHPLGFLNYWLYEAGLHWDGLNDVTSGHNPGCNTEGFYAGEGWDAVTGLGSLNYTLLRQHLIKWS